VGAVLQRAVLTLRQLAGPSSLRELPRLRGASYDAVPAALPAYVNRAGFYNIIDEDFVKNFGGYIK
jgi:hypothetical protein